MKMHSQQNSPANCFAANGSSQLNELAKDGKCTFKVFNTLAKSSRECQNEMAQLYAGAFRFLFKGEMIRTFDEIGFGEEYLPHQSCLAIYIYHCKATDYLFGGDRHTSYVAKRGQSPIWSAHSALEVVRIISGVPKRNASALCRGIAGFWGRKIYGSSIRTMVHY